MKRNRLAPDLVSVVMRQLSDALRSGLSLHDTLAILAKDTELGKNHVRLIAHLSENQAAGGALSSALAEYPATFPPEAIALVRAGEQDGSLSQSLGLIATDFELRVMQLTGLKGALTWPMMIFTVVVVILAVIMIFVIPTFKNVFSSFGADLPGSTLIVIALSDFAVDWWFLGAALAGVVIYLFNYGGTHFGRIAVLDATLLKIPFVRGYLVKTFISRLTHIFVATTEKRLPLVPAVAYLRATAGNLRLSRLAGSLEAQLAGGKDLVAAVRETPDMPGHLVVALELGTRANNLAAALSQIVTWGEEEAARSLVRLQQAFIAWGYVVAGVIVGGIVVAMYLPIFKLGSVV